MSKKTNELAENSNGFKKIIIKSGEYRVCDVISSPQTFTTYELNEDISCTFYSSILNKVALARNINKQQLLELLGKLNPNNLTDKKVIDVHIIGGSSSESSVKNAKLLFKELLQFNSETETLNIIGYDVNEKEHPNSFDLDCWHGEITPLNYLNFMD